MTVSRWLTVLVILGVAITVGLSSMGKPVPASAVDTVFVMHSETARVVADGTIKVVTRIQHRVDSILRFDTTVQHDTVLVRSVDTLRVACQRCALELLAYRRYVVDTLAKAKDDTIARLRSELAACKSRRAWWAGGGLVTGLAVCRR